MQVIVMQSCKLLLYHVSTPLESLVNCSSLHFLSKVASFMQVRRSYIKVAFGPVLLVNRRIKMVCVIN